MCIVKLFKVVNALLIDKLGRILRKLLLNPFQRRRLTFREFSIISQNCVGSVWYHDLGLRFSSPTINMKFDPNDYIVFLQNINKYFNSQINFISTDKTYPCGKIGGEIFVEFVHYHSAIEVVKKWEERKKRIKGTIVVLAFDEGMTDGNILKFLSLHEFPNRIMFIDSNRAVSLGLVGNKHIIEVKGSGNATLLNFSDIIGHRKYDTYFDYVSYLNNLI